MVTTSDQFVGIDLVASIPDQSIFSEIENTMQCETQFDNPEVGCEVGCASREKIAKHIANLATQRFQLLHTHRMEGFGGLEF
jgi:hypothetical protein